METIVTVIGLASLIASGLLIYQQGKVAGRKQERKLVEFNINGPVYFKPTDLGKELLKKRNDEFEALMQQRGINFHCADFRVTPDGWHERPMWEVMEIFGPHITLGGEVPFETTIRIKADF